MEKFNFTSDDHIYTKMLYDTMNKSDDSLKDLAFEGLNFSEDEVFRSVCVEYLDFFNTFDENSLLKALSDDEEIVKIVALTAAENFESDKVNEKLRELSLNECSEFVVAWSIATLGVKSLPFDDIMTIKETWDSSELVGCSISFFIASKDPSDCNVFDFFRYMESEDHLVRGMVVNLSDRFFDCKRKKQIQELLVAHKENEPMKALRELIDWKIESL